MNRKIANACRWSTEGCDRFPRDGSRPRVKSRWIGWWSCRCWSAQRSGATWEVSFRAGCGAVVTCVKVDRGGDGRAKREESDSGAHKIPYHHRRQQLQAPQRRKFISEQSKKTKTTIKVHGPPFSGKHCEVHPWLVCPLFHHGWDFGCPSLSLPRALTTCPK